MRPLADGVAVLGTFVDALELSWEPVQSGRWGVEAADDLERTLSVLRASARQARAQSVPSGWLTADGETVRAAGRGVRQVAYQLDCADWLAGIGTDGAPGPRGFFQLRAAHLASSGPLAGYESVRSWVETNLAPLVGRRVEGADDVWRIARVDLAVDLVGVSFSGSDLHAFTTRASSRRTHEEPAVSDYERREFTGFRFGRRGGALFARLYKKSAEAASDAWVREHWREAGYLPEKHGDVWRVEFEIRGALLRELLVDGERLPRAPEAVLTHHLSSIWRYATQSWLVLHEDSRSRLSRSPVAPWWAALAALSDFEQEPTGARTVRRARVASADPRHLLMMAVGVLSSLAAIHGQETWPEVRAGLDRYIVRSLGADEFARRVREKASAHEPLPPLPEHWLDVLLATDKLPSEWFSGEIAETPSA